GAVPVAELLPELGPDTGLTLQGVEDGGLLTVTAGVDEPPPRVYDDVVEAMADVVEEDLEPWRPATGRRTALVAASLFLALGAAALLVQRGSDLAAGATVAVAVGLCAGAVVLSRVQREAEAAVGVAWLGAGYAAAAGVMLAPQDAALLGRPLAWAGAGALLAGLACVLGLGAGRTLVFPPVVVGALGLVLGLYLDAGDGAVGAAEVMTVVLCLVVLAGSVFPWLALGATSTRVPEPHPVTGAVEPDATTPTAPTAPPGTDVAEIADLVAGTDRADRAAGVDVARQQVAADARVAHEILLAITGTVGLLVVVAAPLAVSLGVAGTLLAVDACLVVMLRTRQYRTGSEVLAGLVSGVAGLAATALAVLVLHDDWRPTLSALLAVVGAVLLVATLVPAAPSVRRGRLGDVLESTALIALLPLLVVAVGLFESVRGALG
ncbi:type VII secretion integral membrane protein EccD, partial [Nocardioides sp. J9]|uniref:type VII secretion integral membrane protein EccD n=1 Tax=Nocardioides sp. J9 TaxID=935844 RepID=UPI0016476465